MKQLILTFSVVSCVAVMQGCTITISSAGSVATPTTQRGVEGSKGMEGQPGVSNPVLPQRNAVITPNKPDHNVTGPKNRVMPNSITLSPKNDTGLSAKFLLDTAKAIVLGCIQYKC